MREKSSNKSIRRPPHPANVPAASLRAARCPEPGPTRNYSTPTHFQRAFTHAYTPLEPPIDLPRHPGPQLSAWDPLVIDVVVFPAPGETGRRRRVASARFTVPVAAEEQARAGRTHTQAADVAMPVPSLVGRSPHRLTRSPTTPHDPRTGARSPGPLVILTARPPRAQALRGRAPTLRVRGADRRAPSGRPTVRSVHPRRRGGRQGRRGAGREPPREGALANHVTVHVTHTYKVERATQPA